MKKTFLLLVLALIPAISFAQGFPGKTLREKKQIGMGSTQAQGLAQDAAYGVFLIPAALVMFAPTIYFPGGDQPFTIPFRISTRRENKISRITPFNKTGPHLFTFYAAWGPKSILVENWGMGVLYAFLAVLTDWGR